MNYFQEYEKLKKAKGLIQVGSKWKWIGSEDDVAHFQVIKVENNYVLYHYINHTSSLLQGTFGRHRDMIILNALPFVPVIELAQ